MKLAIFLGSVFYWENWIEHFFSLFFCDYFHEQLLFIFVRQSSGKCNLNLFRAAVLRKIEQFFSLFLCDYFVEPLLSVILSITVFWESRETSNIFSAAESSQKIRTFTTKTSVVSVCLCLSTALRVRDICNYMSVWSLCGGDSFRSSKTFLVSNVTHYLLQSFYGGLILVLWHN